MMYHKAKYVLVLAIIFLHTGFVFAIKCKTFESIEESFAKGTFEARPSLPFSFETAHFRIWFDTTGVNRIYPFDADVNLIPDYAESTAAYLEYAYNKLLEQKGFRAPLPDSLGTILPDQYGGSTKCDFYLMYMGYGVYGQTIPQFVFNDGICSKATAFSKIQSDLTIISSYNANPYPALKVTCAHEFFHMLQFAYRYPANSFELDKMIWWMEASSVFSEELCFDEVNDYYALVNEFQHNTSLALTSPDQRSFYGAVMFPIFIEERYFGTSHHIDGESVKRIWEITEENYPLNAIEIFLLEHDLIFDSVFAEFTHFRMRTGSFWRAGYLSEGEFYSTPTLDTIDLTEEHIENIAVQPLATHFFFVPNQYETRGVIANLSSTASFMRAGMYSASIEPSNLAVDNGFTVTPLNIWNGYAGLWQYRGIVVAPLLFSALGSVDFSLHVQKAESLSVPVSQLNSIGDAYPNPCTTDSIVFPVEVIFPAQASILIFSTAGELVWQHSAQVAPPLREFFWNLTSDSGKKVKSGVYVYIVQLGNESKKGKIFIP